MNLKKYKILMTHFFELTAVLQAIIQGQISSNGKSGNTLIWSLTNENA
uniref:Uncharacterized protein n=1 Tax=Anguilla anguilla TaxID=7936 RepID=A0A0E9RAD1_ANGAN